MKTILFGLAAIAAPTVVAAQTAPAPATYVMKAAASDLYEIESSKLVLATTKNSALKTFATEMIANHNKSTADVKAAVMKSGLAPKPPMLDAMGSKNIAALKAASGEARDTLYIKQQKVAHQSALALHQAYSTTGSAPALRSVAATIVPVVQHHIEVLSSM